jgi:hypothetical protein
LANLTARRHLALRKYAALRLFMHSAIKDFASLVKWMMGFGLLWLRKPILRSLSKA